MHCSMERKAYTTIIEIAIMGHWLVRGGIKKVKKDTRNIVPQSWFNSGVLYNLN